MPSLRSFDSCWVGGQGGGDACCINSHIYPPGLCWSSYCWLYRLGVLNVTFFSSSWIDVTNRENYGRWEEGGNGNPSALLWGLSFSGTVSLQEVPAPRLSWFLFCFQVTRTSFLCPMGMTLGPSPSPQPGTNQPLSGQMRKEPQLECSYRPMALMLCICWWLKINISNFPPGSRFGSPTAYLAFPFACLKSILYTQDGQNKTLFPTPKPVFFLL